jgi:hypothetical protein
MEERSRCKVEKQRVWLIKVSLIEQTACVCVCVASFRYSFDSCFIKCVINIAIQWVWAEFLNIWAS